MLRQGWSNFNLSAMRKVCLVLSLTTILCLSFFEILIAQQYVIGISTVPGQGSVLMSFRNGSLRLDQISTMANQVWSPMSISDSNDSLLFHSNGAFVENRYLRKMPGTDSLAPGFYYDYGPYCLNGIIGVKRGDPSGQLYDLFHMDYSNHLTYPYPLSVLHTEINPYARNDSGECLVNSEVVLSADTFEPGLLAAVQHGNGRDWWVLVQKFTSNKYYKILSTPHGRFVSDQVIGFPKVPYLGIGTPVFSPDGNWYARFDFRNGLELFNFDRCSGELSNPVLLPTLANFPDTNQFYYNPVHNDFVGLAFSADSRFLYVVQVTQIYQLDMTLLGQAGSIRHVASYDGTRDTSNGQVNQFGFPFLAPDSVIYLYCGGGKWIASIPNPDLPAPACGFNRSALYYPGLGYSKLPSPPNYRLGRLLGSPCDTLEWTGTRDLEKESISVYPNPASSAVRLRFGDADRQYDRIELRSLTGALLKELLVSGQEPDLVLSLKGIAPGSYLVQAYREGALCANHRLVVVND